MKKTSENLFLKRRIPTAETSAHIGTIDTHLCNLSFFISPALTRPAPTPSPALLAHWE